MTTSGGTATIDQIVDIENRAATDPAFRQQLVSAPAATLQSAGVSIPSGTSVQVLENTANSRYLVVDPSTDANLKAQLLQDPKAALAKSGVTVPAGITVQAVEAAPGVAYLTLPPSGTGTISSDFSSLTKLITAGSYLAGLGFSIGAIMKFKQHKDNPTQIPIGTPIALEVAGAALLFLPTITTTSGG